MFVRPAVTQIVSVVILMHNSACNVESPTRRHRQGVAWLVLHIAIFVTLTDRVLVIPLPVRSATHATTMPLVCHV